MAIDYKTNELKELSFSSVLSRLGVSVEQKGRRLVTKCLWHDDSHPSLFINEEKHYCHCFVCGRSWSTIDYVMQYQGVGFKEACEWLAPSNSPKGGGLGNERNVQKADKKRKKGCDEVLREFGISEKVRFPEVGEVEDEWAWFNPDYMMHFVSVENSLSKCLLQLFDRQTVEDVTHNYCLGCYHFRSQYVDYRDDVMFPTIDKDMVVRNIKLQHYETNPKSPRFMHCDRKHILWMGKLLQDQGEFPADAKFDNSHLFGEHLLGMLPDKIVALVESPKNAILGACAMPQYVWVATGNKTNISRQNMECLRDRKVIVFPDVDAMDFWKKALGGMASIANFTFSSLMDEIKEKCGEKGDVGDWIVGGQKR